MAGGKGLRWWTRNQGQLALTVVLILAALWVRQTQAAWINECWYWLNAPLIGSFSSAPPSLVGNRITELEGRVTGLEQENQRLKTLLNLPADTLGTPLTAQVIGRDGDHWWRSVLVNRGSTEGVLVGNPVTTTGGLVGQVTATSDHTARVLLISDPTSKIGVMVSRTGAAGVLSGQFRNEAIVEFFDGQAQVKVGDILVTSGLSSRFPANLTVGKVLSLPDKRTETIQVKVRLSVPLDAVQWVNLYPQFQKTALPDVQPNP